MSKRRKRRTWSDDEKREICQQTAAPGVSVAQVARRYALNANMIHTWLKPRRMSVTPAANHTRVLLGTGIKPSILAPSRRSSSMKPQKKHLQIATTKPRQNC